MLRYVRSERGFCVMAPDERRPHWADVLREAPVAHWAVGTNEFVGRAVPLDRESVYGEISHQFEVAFGTECVDDWFGGRRVGFVLIPQSGIDSGSSKSMRDYFDAVADTYDAQVLSNPLDVFLRTISLQVLESIFDAPARILEIGCGTGLETLPLAHDGLDIVAVDVSARMLAILMAKAKKEGVADRVTPIQLRGRDLGSIATQLGIGTFDGAFSTFGALNCEPDLQPVARAMARLLRPGRPAVLGVWNRFCASEFVGYSTRARPRRAYARFRDPVPVGLSRFGLPVHAYSVREVARAFAPDFAPHRVIGLPVFLPPYDFQHRFPASHPLVPLLERVDQKFRGKFPFNRVGDHFVLELIRR